MNAESACCRFNSMGACCGVCNSFCCNCNLQFGCRTDCLNSRINLLPNSAVTTDATLRFNSIDLDRDGSIFLKEDTDFLNATNSLPSTNDEWFAVLDGDKNGKIEPSEFDSSLQ